MTPSTPAACTCARSCPACGRSAPPGRRFCGGCRALLVRVCARCGFGNERDDAWCGGCGSALSARAEVAAGKAAGAEAIAAGVEARAVAQPARPAIPAIPAIPPPRVAGPAPAAVAPVAATAAAAVPRPATPIAELMAINARRSPVLATDTAAQAQLDELFGAGR